MAKTGNKGLYRLYKAAGYSWLGLCAAWKHEAAFRQESVLALLLTPVACWLANDAVQFSLLIGSLMLVLIVELINSGLESVVDRIGDEPHELSGRAKDVGSAAVLLALTLAVLVWASILLPIWNQH